MKNFGLKVLPSEVTETSTNKELESICFSVIEQPANWHSSNYNLGDCEYLKDLVSKYMEAYDKYGITYDYYRAMLAVSVLNDVIYTFRKYKRDEVFGKIDDHWRFSSDTPKTWLVWYYVLQQREKGGYL